MKLYIWKEVSTETGQYNFDVVAFAASRQEAIEQILRKDLTFWSDGGFLKSPEELKKQLESTKPTIIEKPWSSIIIGGFIEDVTVL